MSDSRTGRGEVERNDPTGRNTLLQPLADIDTTLDPGPQEPEDDRALARMLAVAFLLGLLMIWGIVALIWRLLT
jgi:hypothetical protein